jgi:hypothetical protein
LTNVLPHAKKSFCTKAAAGQNLGDGKHFHLSV